MDSLAVVLVRNREVEFVVLSVARACKFLYEASRTALLAFSWLLRDTSRRCGR